MRINHPDTSQSEQTWLSAPFTAGGVTLTVQSSHGFAVNDYAVIGELGQERSEIHKISAVTSTTIVFTGDAITYDHPTNTPVTSIRFNKIRVYSSETEDGSYTQITGSPFSIDSDRPFTAVFNADETTSTWYKITYYNSTSLLESDFSDAMSATGPTEGSVRELITDVRRDCKLGSDDQVVSDDDIIAIFNDCQDYIQNKKGFTNQEAITTLSSVANQVSYTLPSDLLKIRDIAITGSGNQIYYPTYIERDQFNMNEPVTPTSGSTPTWFTVWARNLYIRPIAASSATNDIKILYYKRLARLNSDQDVPDIAQTELLVYYADMIISAIRENYKAVAFWEKRFETSLRGLLDTGAGMKQVKNFNRVKRSSTRPTITNWPRTIG